MLCKGCSYNVHIHSQMKKNKTAWILEQYIVVSNWFFSSYNNFSYDISIVDNQMYDRAAICVDKWWDTRRR